MLPVTFVSGTRLSYVSSKVYFTVSACPVFQSGPKVQDTTWASVPVLPFLLCCHCWTFGSGASFVRGVLASMSACGKKY